MPTTLEILKAAVAQVNVAELTLARTTISALAARVVELNKVPPTLAISDQTQAEGNAGESLMLFTVTRGGDASGYSSVVYATADGTGNKTDYKPTSGSLIFGPGQTSKAIAVTILGDKYPEADNTFTVNLSKPVNATIIDGVGLGTIKDDDTTAAAAPKPIPAPPVKPPLPPTPGKLPTKLIPGSGNAVELKTKGATLGPTQFLWGQGTAVYIDADNVVVTGVKLTRFGQYGFEINSGKGVKLIGCETSIGSDFQAHCRTMDAACEVELVDCVFIDTLAEDKAITRGPGTWHFRGGRYGGAAMGAGNALWKDDGGQGWLRKMILLGVAVDGTYIYHAKNEAECMAAVDAAIARGVTDALALAKIFRDVAILWTNDSKTASFRCADKCPDSQLQRNIERRAKDIASSGDAYFTEGTVLERGFSMDPGSVRSTDSSVRVVTSGTAIASFNLHYPEPAMAMPYDVPRGTPLWIGDDTVIDAKGGWGAPPDVLKVLLRGTFIVAGVRENYGSAA